MTESRANVPRGATTAARLLFGIIVAPLAFLFAVATYGLSDDHFGRISPARQIARYGELPFRDFFDPGYYLTELSSAWLQRLLGDSLLAEALLNTTFIAGGALFVALIARRVTRSVVGGAAAAFVALASMPRDYDFDKFLFYPLGIWLCWRYVDRRSVGALMLLAATIVVAALYRYDNGIYIAIATLVAIGVAHGRESGVRWRRAGLFLAALVVLALPPLVVLQLTGGVANATRQVLTYARRETARSRLHGVPSFHVAPPPQEAAAPPPDLIQVRWAPGVDDASRSRLETRFHLQDGRPRGEPADRTWSYRLADVSSANIRALVSDAGVDDTNGIDRARSRLEPTAAAPPWSRAARLWRRLATMENATSWLFYVFILLPIVTAGVILRRLRASGADALEAARALSLATLCVLVGALILRDPLYARIGGAIAPGVLLVTWCAAALCSSDGRRRPLRITAAVLLVLITVLSVGTMAEWRVTLPRARAALPHVPSLLRGLAVSPPPLDYLPNSGIAPLVRYLRSCTAPDDRIYATWFVPELYFFTQRAFAGGMVVTFGAHWTEPSNQQRIVEWLRGQRVPLVVMQTAREEGFGEEYPLVAAYLRTRYSVAGRSQLRRSGDADDRGYTVLVDRGRHPAGVDAASGMPCFGSGSAGGGVRVGVD